MFAELTFDGALVERRRHESLVNGMYGSLACDQSFSEDLTQQTVYDKTQHWEQF